MKRRVPSFEKLLRFDTAYAMLYDYTINKMTNERQIDAVIITVYIIKRIRLQNRSKSRCG